MAAAVELYWPAEAPLSGLVVTRYGHGQPTGRVEVVEASHPLPDGRGEAAALRMLDMAQALGPDDMLLALISGGGSSLLAAPVDGVSLKELRRVTKALLHAGASIHDINTVRKHLTRLSGGRLARAAAPARVLALVISDVVGDDPADIASGPCAPDLTSCADALRVLQHYAVVPPPAVRDYLQAHLAVDDTAKPAEACFVRTENKIIANARVGLDAAQRFFAERGIDAIVLSDRVGSEAAVAARTHAALAHSTCRRPLALISGGETNVALGPTPGRGGRNTEFLLALGLALDMPCWAIACDTDGLDGSEDNAGAVWTPDTLERARVLGLAPQSALDAHDSYGFFDALGDLVISGPTRTNINDYRVLLLGA